MHPSANHLLAIAKASLEERTNLWCYHKVALVVVVVVAISHARREQEDEAIAAAVARCCPVVVAVVVVGRCRAARQERYIQGRRGVLEALSLVESGTKPRSTDRVAHSGSVPRTYAQTQPLSQRRAQRNTYQEPECKSFVGTYEQSNHAPDAGSECKSFVGTYEPSNHAPDAGSECKSFIGTYEQPNYATDAESQYIAFVGTVEQPNHATDAGSQCKPFR